MKVMIVYMRVHMCDVLSQYRLLRVCGQVLMEQNASHQDKHEAMYLLQACSSPTPAMLRCA